MSARAKKTTRAGTGTVLAFPKAKSAPAAVRSVCALAPPPFLTKAQTQLWIDVVATKPADWFDAGGAALLVGYVRAVCSSNRLALIVDQYEKRKRLDSDAMKAYAAALAAHEKVERRVISFATKMRLTQQSRYRADAADVANRNAAKTPRKPWETV
jgi:hypothetical protein